LFGPRGGRVEPSLCFEPELLERAAEEGGAVGHDLESPELGAAR
jgi:hypothetical protein